MLQGDSFQPDTFQDGPSSESSGSTFSSIHYAGNPLVESFVYQSIPGFTGVFSVMGPGGSPMRPPYGLFAGKSINYFTIMGPAGAPMRPPYGLFTGKAPSPPSEGIADWLIIARRRHAR